MEENEVGRPTRASYRTSLCSSALAIREYPFDANVVHGYASVDIA
jgi:hypothetical protein